MMTSSGGAAGHFGAVDETTKRLVGRCVRVPWLKEEVGEGHAAKKLLGIGVVGAMESSLSVLEVAAHKEKPGVQTPSRGKEALSENLDTGLKNGNGAKLELNGAAIDGKGQGEAKSPFEVESEA